MVYCSGFEVNDGKTLKLKLQTSNIETKNKKGAKHKLCAFLSLRL